MPAVALTDHGSLAGAVQLFREARATGVKPILGCEAYVADDRTKQTKGYAHLTLLAESNEGYANLIKLSSLGYLEGYYYKPRVDWELLERHSKRLDRALGLPRRPRLARALREPRPRRARRPRPARPDLRPRLDLRRDPERGPRGAGRAQPQARRARRADRPPARRDRRRPLPRRRGRVRPRGAPLHPVGRHAQEPEPLALRHERVLLQVAGGDGGATSPASSTPWRARSRSRSAARSSSSSAASCSRPSRCPEGRDAFDYLVELCEKGLGKRYGKATPELTDRLRFELKTIKEMGFADYFLIVWDFIHFAKSERRQRRARAAARRPARSRRTASRSPTSIRSATASSSSAS